MCSISWGFYACIFGGFCAILQKNSKIVSYSFAVATYPREGTETIHHLQWYLLVLGCNLSPRGDGNKEAMGILADESMLQLIPARGRKLPACRQSVARQGLQLIPARGRKHSSPQPSARRHLLQLIPARGRKLPTGPGVLHPLHLLQLIPARGRKRDNPVKDSLAPYGCNLSPRGDGNLSAFSQDCI